MKTFVELRVYYNPFPCSTLQAQDSFLYADPNEFIGSQVPRLFLIVSWKTSPKFSFSVFSSLPISSFCWECFSSCTCSSFFTFLQQAALSAAARLQQLLCTLTSRVRPDVSAHRSRQVFRQNKETFLISHRLFFPSSNLFFYSRLSDDWCI